MTDVLREGQMLQLGAVRVGLMVVNGEQATVLIDGPAGRVKATVRASELLPVGDALYRVSSVQAGAATRTPGSSTAQVQLDAAQPDGLPARQTGSLVLPLGAVANRAGFDFTIASIGADGAQAEAWPDTLARANTKPELIVRSMVKAGDALRLGAASLPVVSVVPANPSLGHQGWVEIGAPTR